MKVREPMNKHKVVAGKPLDGTLGVAVSFRFCVKHLKGRLELVSKDVKYAVQAGSHELHRHVWRRPAHGCGQQRSKSSRRLHQLVGRCWEPSDGPQELKTSSLREPLLLEG